MPTPTLTNRPTLTNQPTNRPTLIDHRHQQQTGYQLDRPALQAVFARFDPTRRGALGLAEFLALTLFLRRWVRMAVAGGVVGVLDVV